MIPWVAGHDATQDARYKYEPAGQDRQVVAIVLHVRHELSHVLHVLLVLSPYNPVVQVDTH